MKSQMYLIIVIFLLLFSPLLGKELAVLEGILKPSIIDIHKDHLYVMDAEKIRVYSLKDYTLLNAFGKKGEGPGEYKIILGIPLRLQVFDEYLMVESYDKLLFFDHEGKYLREKRKNPFIGMISPIGKNFVARRVTQPQDGSRSVSAMKIYNQDFEERKELYHHDFIQQGAGLNLRIDLGQDFIHYGISDDKIFVDESKKGFVIEVFDFEGNKLYEINHDFEKIPITGGIQKKLIKEY